MARGGKKDGLFPSGETPSQAGGAGTLSELAARVEACRACPLCETRVKPVFGSGDPDAELMVVGEAPGKNEDLAGEPFVGAAGRRLDALLAEAGLARGDIYIANVLKCRPPGNRDPRAGEVEVCSHWLAGQLALVRPSIVVTLGNFATRFVLKTKEGITQLHGRLVQAGPFLVMPTFHPAAAIYDRSKAEALRGDFRRLKELLEAKAPLPAATGQDGGESLC